MDVSTNCSTNFHSEYWIGLKGEELLNVKSN